MIRSTARLSGWGRYRPVDVDHYRAAGIDDLARSELPVDRLIARGLGRSYGDAAHRTAGAVIDTTDCTGAEWVDRSRGVIRADAGTTIGGLIDRYAPKGWFVPVTPGTRQVTVGGAIAADIHGKNHHLDGSFGDHVRSLRLRLAVISQRLAKRVNGGRIPVLEIMRDAPVVRKMILEGRATALPQAIANRELGMQLFDQHLGDLYREGVISGTEALRLATNPEAVALALRGITSGDTGAGLVG